MDGSRHEKAALVIVAYAIGAVTAFIYYTEPPRLENLPVTNFEAPRSAQSASVINAATQVAVQDTAQVSNTEQSSLIVYEGGLLKVQLPEGERVLSFNGSLDMAVETEDFLTQGIHFGELLFKASPTNEYVFFCEKKSIEADTCSPFVFDVLTDTIYPVRQNGVLVDLLTSAEPVWNGSVLTIGSDSSSDPLKPWLLGY